MRRIVCGATALTLGLGSAIVLCEAAAHRTKPPVQGVAPTIVEPWEIEPVRLAGHWRREKDASKLIVTRKGEVWSDSGAMQGSARPGHAGANFAFGNGTFLCAYRLTFTGADATDWQLIDHTPATTCPEGRFTRAAGL
jgi:hypothetical protein